MLTFHGQIAGPSVMVNGTLKPPRRLKPALLTGLVVLACAGGGYGLSKHHGAKQVAQVGDAGDMTGSLSAPSQFGHSGLPLPRFASLKADKVNVHKGPSSDHAVAWVYTKKGLPVEITAEFETWRRIRDSDGSEGWILQNMLSGKRTGLVAPSRKGSYVNMMSSPSLEAAPEARLAAGVMGEIKSCDGIWCLINASGYNGYVDQNVLWGAYPGEAVN